MLVAGERLSDEKEASHGPHAWFEGGVAMVAGDGVVHRFPESLDDVDPGMIGRLEQELDARMMRRPGTGDAALVELVVITGLPVDAPDCIGIDPFDLLQ